MLITGATGSLGGELVARYHGEYQVFAQGRDAQRLLRLQMRYPSVRLVLGDLRCHGLQEAMSRCRLVIHAAAQKYVDLAEQHCFHTVDTNVVCTHDLADLAARRGVERFVFISTDKSSAPGNVYGITKYLAERLILELSGAHPGTAFVVCRMGNIFGSNGSVVRLWLDAVRGGRAVLRVTDPDMTRFMFSLDDAADAVHFSLTEAQDGDVVIPKMGSVSIRDILALFPEAETRIVGPRPGEKTHETLYVRGETDTGIETDRYYVLNRSAPRRLTIGDVDSSRAQRVEAGVLKAWFEKVRNQVA